MVIASAVRKTVNRAGMLFPIAFVVKPQDSWTCGKTAQDCLTRISDFNFVSARHQMRATA
jgi:hypothetical protein